MPQSRLVHLHRCRGVSRARLRQMLRFDPSLEKIYTLRASHLQSLISLPTKHLHALYDDIHNETLWTKAQHDRQNWSAITIFDDAYPHVLKTIKDRPLVLYTAGETDLLKESPSLSVIGTRNPSRDAGTKLMHILPGLIDYGWVIVSGMAKGIDGHAHKLALGMGGKTIAVLGSGFRHIYPKQHEKLFRDITTNGLAISEYPPDMPARRHHFPERNRIISALGFGTLVIEAMEQSGTMITVDQALDQGREVYAVPGSVAIPQTKGCHRMIQDGALLVHDAGDIIGDWKMRQHIWIGQ